MIRQLTTSDVQELSSILEENYEKCIYIYLDLLYSNQSLSQYPTYYSEVNGCWKWILMEVDDSAQILLLDSQYSNELARFIHSKNYKIVFGTKTTTQTIAENLQLKKTVNGYIALLEEYVEFPSVDNINVIKNPSEFTEIANLICSDEEMGAVNNPEQLAITLRQRNKIGYGRNYIIKDGETVIAHVATYAESKKIAVIGGVITKKEYRGKGLAKHILLTLCNDLVQEGKKVYLFYYNPQVFTLYSKIGFKNQLVWSKLFIDSFCNL